MTIWDNLFSLVGQPIAQILLTRSDIADVRHYFLSYDSLLMNHAEDTVPECTKYSLRVIGDGSRSHCQ
jgi:glutamate 5-kinase